MCQVKRQVEWDGTETNKREVKKARMNPKFESVRAFLANYFAPENGRCEKLPNPRYGREEYRLPIWLSKTAIYNSYKKDCEASGSKSPSRLLRRCQEVFGCLA